MKDVVNKEIVNETVIKPVKTYMGIWEMGTKSMMDIGESYIKNIVIPMSGYMLEMNSKDKREKMIEGANEFIRTNMEFMVTIRKYIEVVTEEYRIKNMVNDIVKNVKRD
ncbi:MAG: hypothetical protein M1411_03585 [Candidatus Thermoplasmatota archaeon]|nr:hypothetical protein [Candidatus Thermoplasmatota archaeon]